MVQFELEFNLEVHKCHIKLAIPAAVLFIFLPLQTLNEILQYCKVK